jgi:hypothetical protein
MRIEITAATLDEVKDAAWRIADALDRDFSSIAIKTDRGCFVSAILTFPNAALLTDAASAGDGGTLPPSSPARNKEEPQ